jgi:catechol 2,3-dioxygenase-like lactoylglutathione lyase family enzyme
MNLRAHHTCISVADIDAATAWYGETLGFETERRFEIPSGAKVALLRAPGGALIELTEVASSNEGIAWKDPGQALATRGMTHIAFEVDDVDASFGQVVAHGGAPVWEPRDGTGGVRMAFVHDSEGNLIELTSLGSATTTEGQR